MNVLPGDGPPLHPELWEKPAMRAALARHDISEVYRLLGAAGVSQRRIAASTCQSQSEISDIAQGRQVQAYDVLARIADGLGIPRGYMGLAYSPTSQQFADHTTSTTHKDDHMERRMFLGLVSKIVMGAGLTAAEIDLITVHPQTTPVPQRVGATEVAELRTLTEALRSYDAAHGGGSCRDAIVAHTGWAEAMLNADMTDTVRADLLSAVTDLKTVAGWTAHDLGLAKEARSYIAQAVQTAKEADDPGHTAIALHHLGRVPLDNGDPTEALKLFQLGQISAQDSRSSSIVSLLLVDQAMAYAQVRDARQATTALRRAEDEFAHADHDEDPVYLRFFDRGALETHAARMHSALGLTDGRHREEAVKRLQRAITEAPTVRARQRAFNLAWLATCHFADGDTGVGTALGVQALDVVRDLRSVRILDHLAPLQAQAERYVRDTDASHLAHEIRRLRTSA
jgi:transcriptional regulator with XRE-family HTH domain/tetratricopeptide (TPR) repeat protein